MPETPFKDLVIKPRFRLPVLASVVVGLVLLVLTCGGSDPGEITA